MAFIVKMTVNKIMLDNKINISYKAIIDKKGNNIVALDLKERTSFTDYFLICSGSSSRQVQSIANEIVERLKTSGTKDIYVEGYQNGKWILIDCMDLIVHIFHEETRSYYNIERLWGDTPHLNLN